MRPAASCSASLNRSDSVVAESVPERAFLVEPMGMAMRVGLTRREVRWPPKEEQERWMSIEAAHAMLTSWFLEDGVNVEDCPVLMRADDGAWVRVI